ncbi:hypothetical protein [Aromatoleum evansii]|uniref:hypothetical protein n=1 Tax=Aromatoleum evansii TaxID=59406 RepID=UPI00145F00D6|nr:hypothetical protein [Aromatoleum evansii]NMG29827.1 hypothetical protein [Aromatoleum evansii]
MFSSLRKDLSRKYCPRFGQIAIELGFITESQLTDALACQVREELSGQGHRLLGAILFDTDVLTAAQVEQVTTELFRRLRGADTAANDSARRRRCWSPRNIW